MPEETPLPSPAPEVSLEKMRYEEDLCKEMGLPSPYGMKVLQHVCAKFVESGFAPQYFKANPSALFMAAMRGRELGIPPTEAIMETFWAAPGGKLGMFANKMLDLMHRGGVHTVFEKNDAEGCVIVCEPPGSHPTFTASFYYQEAHVAGLVRGDSNWLKWPADMCKARAISRAYRALAGTFDGGGNFYSKEELEDMEDTSSNGHASPPIPEKEVEAQAEAEFKPGRRATVVEMPSENAAPPPPPSPSEAVRARIAHLNERMGQGNARVLNAFVRGFTGVTEIPRGKPEFYHEALEALATALEQDGAIEEVLANPQVYGAKLGGKAILHPADYHFNYMKWNDRTKELGKVLYEAIKFENPKSFEDYTRATGLIDFDNENAQAYCRIASRILNTNNLLNLSEDWEMSISEILRAIETSRGNVIENLPPAEIQTAIEEAINNLRASAAGAQEAPEDELPF